MSEPTSKFTRGQLERTISQKLQALYRNQLGHQPSKITCQLFDEKLAIIVEDSITPPEQLLADHGKAQVAEQLRSDLDDAIKPQIQALIEEILQVCVVDLLSDAKLETGRSGMIAILANKPEMRDRDSMAKARK